MERLEEKYLRWVFGLDSRTPGYLIREEVERDKLRERAGRRAWRFERRLEEGKGSKLARLCWEEVRRRGRERETGSGWEEERRKFFEDRGGDVREVEERRKEGDRWFEEMMRRDKESQREDRKQRIKESRYNRWYKEIRVEGVPEYLRKGWGESR